MVFVTIGLDNIAKNTWWYSLYLCICVLCRALRGDIYIAFIYITNFTVINSSVYLYTSVQMLGVESVSCLTRMQIFNHKYSKKGTIVKVFYFNVLKCNLFLWRQSWIFSIITPGFSVTWSFRNHSDMLIVLVLSMLTFVLLDIFVETLIFFPRILSSVYFINHFDIFFAWWWCK